MNNREKRGARELLDDVPQPELESLLDTVTNKALKVQSKQETIDAILCYSSSAEELLKRKKITRDFLFSYLHLKRVSLDVKSDKQSLINQILVLWNKKSDKNTSSLVSSSSQKQYDKESSLDAGATQPTNITVNVQLGQWPSSSFNNSPSHPQQHMPTPPVVDDNETVSVAFVKWFFSMINSQNPDMPGESQEYGPQHFWDDCTLQMLVCTPQQSSEESLSGAKLTSERLHALVVGERLLFSPNISRNGMLWKPFTHGMLLILVCGTIHRGQECFGIFHQSFGLVRDPRFENNWKIKMIKLKMDRTDVAALPDLSSQSQTEIDSFLSV